MLNEIGPKAKVGFLLGLVAAGMLSYDVNCVKKRADALDFRDGLVDKEFLELDRMIKAQKIENERQMQEIIRNAENREENPVNGDLVNKLMYIESTNNPEAVSPKGARGKMQIMPATWKEQTTKIYGKPLSFDHAFNPEISRRVGESYLEQINSYLSKGDSKWDCRPLEEKQDLIAAAYNGGPARLKKRGFDINRMPRETINYVNKLRKSRN